MMSTTYPNDPDNREAFTHEGFKLLVQNFLNQGYSFHSFQEGKALFEQNPNAPIALMRHDIDFDLSDALNIARLEHELDIKATFFLMLRTAHYNLMTKENQACVKEIINLGHIIGLHFDNKAYDHITSVQHLNDLCREEISILSKITNYDVQTVSFHRPDDLIIPDGDPALTAPYLHTYDPLFFKQFKYCADSKGLWRYGTPFETDAFQNKQPMHILIHPIWWTETPMKAVDRLNDWAETKTHELKTSMAENCMIFPYNGINEA
jgi:hypothetical protein